MKVSVEPDNDIILAVISAQCSGSFAGNDSAMLIDWQITDGSDTQEVEHQWIDVVGAWKDNWRIYVPVVDQLPTKTSDKYISSHS